MDIEKVFKFCPRCGQKFHMEDGHLQCAACGLSYYLNPKPCTAVIFINDKGEYMLTKRAFEPGIDLWDLPGGFVEENETFEENACREVKEELGIDIDPTTLVYLTSHSTPYLYQDILHPTLAVCFIAKFPRGAKPIPADDVADFEFFSTDKIPRDKLAFRAMEDDFAAAAKFLQANEL